MSKASAGNFVRNQSIAAAFLIVEVLAAFQLGLGNLLAWLLLTIAAWNATLFITGMVGVAMIASKAINAEEASK